MTFFRFWGCDKYEKLASVKETRDPTKVFGCRHCIGEEIEKTATGPNTMPPWRISTSKKLSLFKSEAKICRC